MESMDKLCEDPFNELVQFLIDGSETAAMILGRVLPLSTNTKITYVCLSVFLAHSPRASPCPERPTQTTSAGVDRRARQSSMRVFQVRQSPIIFLPTSARAPELKRFRRGAAAES